MRRVLTLLLTASVFLSCQSGKKPVGETLDGYWDRHEWHVTEGQVDKAEERFAAFAELAVAAPKEQGIAALGALLDTLKAKDEVDYYVYVGWVEGAFYNPLSPCRSFDLFSYAVSRYESDGILSPDECMPLQQKRRWMGINLPGEVAVYPEADPEGRSTLVLVIDLSCPSCRESLSRLAALNEWADARHIAICLGYGNIPDVPGWEYRSLKNASEWFDIRMTPVYYIIDPAGVVIQTYTSVL